MRGGSRVKLSDTIPHQLVLPLESLILTPHHSLDIRVSSGQVTLVIKSLVQAADSVLLSLNLTAIVLDHGVALVLESLILSLSLDELPLELLHFLIVWAISCE